MNSSSRAGAGFPHGIMFHHFHGGEHLPSQGSICADELAHMLRMYSRNHRLIPAREWYEKALADELAEDEVCLTFDDALLCQYEIALPVLEHLGLTGFWFVYSSVLMGKPELLEIYRRFRTEYYEDIDGFYEDFFNVVLSSPYADETRASLASYRHADWSHFPFYTENDTRFRFIRDNVLGAERYDEIMAVMMEKAGVAAGDLAEGLWMTAAHIRRLHDDGHMIGLHSHTHPTAMARLPAEVQAGEYRQNHEYLRDLLGEPPVTAAHPCNSYGPETLEILRRLGIRLGFRANMQRGHSTLLEMPREDHANLTRNRQR